jgi:hypothetical protein
MRQERTLINGTGEYTFFFQIAKDGGRRACCVKVDALNIHEASALFRQKWSVIELMAREDINSKAISGGVITPRYALMDTLARSNDTSSFPLCSQGTKPLAR